MTGSVEPKNLGNIEDLIQAGASLENLSKRQKNCLETIKRVVIAHRNKESVLTT